MHTLSSRVNVLNALTPETKRRLAHLATELYSHSYQGLYDWLRQVPDDVMAPLGIVASRDILLQHLVLLANQRRDAAIQGIVQNVGVQANQHFAEPAGVAFNSDIYRVMEFYKANVAQEFLQYVDTMNRQRHGRIQDYDDRILEYMQIQFLGLCARYTTAARREPRHFKEMRLWHVIYKVPTTILTVAARRHGLRSSLINRNVTVRTVHVRVSVRLDTGTYELAIEDPTGGSRTTICTDAAELWHAIQTQAAYPGATLHVAALAGGLFEMCLGPLWKRTLVRDNRLIYTMAWMMTLPSSPVRMIHDYVMGLPSMLEGSPALQISQSVTHLLGPRRRLAMGFVSITDEYIREATFLYERHVLDAIALRGGYDDLGRSNLVAKLRGALAGLTCIQDVAAELCEFLSVPYPPEKAELAEFQVDHTGIPPNIIV
jgi:hypothetical protein